MKAFAQRDISYDDFILFMRQDQPGLSLNLVLSKIEWVSHQRGDRIEPVKTTIDGNESIFYPSMREFMQAIMDVGWENGLRPIGYQDVKNETTAIREHLADMRQLAFTLLEIPPFDAKK